MPFGAEEFDHSPGSLQLEKAIISAGFFGYGEDRKVLFKHQRKGFTWLVDQQEVGFGKILVDEIFKTFFHGKFKLAKQNAFIGHISSPPYESDMIILLVFYHIRAPFRYTP
jgi:hypothetical protein